MTIVNRSYFNFADALPAYYLITFDIRFVKCSDFTTARAFIKADFALGWEPSSLLELLFII